MDTGSISNTFVKAVETAAGFTVTVHGRRRSPASGIMLLPGLVITANHVVERDDDLSVALTPDKKFSAALAGRDPGRDLVLLKVDFGSLAPAVGSSQPAAVGLPALAVAKPEDGLVQASFGIINSIGSAARTGDGSLLETYYSSETNPYPGFSGGPLVDLEGRLMGMNTSAFVRGALITIPTGILLRAAKQLVEHGKIRRGFLGVRSQAVELIEANQAALGRSQENGLLLVGIAGRPVQAHGELTAALDEGTPGTQIEVEVLRGGSPQKVSVTVGERP